MKKSEMRVFAINTIDLGYRNQLLGAINAINKYTNYNALSEKCIATPIKTNKLSDDAFCFSNYNNYKTFKQDIFLTLDAYFKTIKYIPRIFVTTYNATETSTPDKNVDMLCRAVKEYYKTKSMGSIFTTVLTSKLYNYKYVHLINTPKHLLTFNSRIKLLKNKKLRKKTLITIGIIHNFSANLVEKNKTLLEEQIEKHSKNKLLKQHIEKIKNFIKSDKKAVICLGGRVAGNEIIFDVNYAKKLMNRCKTLANNNYHITIVNGPRTPSDVSDYLYKETLNIKNIVFHNCKNVAQSDNERKSWRNYSGANEEIFALHKQFGNIYPGILGYDNTIAVHTSDSYSCCETASIGLPTAISSDGIYIDKTVRIDCINIQQLLEPKYVINFENFVNLTTYMKIEPKHLNPNTLSNTLKVFVEAIIKRMK